MGSFPGTFFDPMFWLNINSMYVLFHYMEVAIFDISWIRFKVSEVRVSVCCYKPETKAGFH